jgi:radical SAM additional 4Fe4S-binding domain
MNCAFCYSKNVREEGKELGLTEWKAFVDDNDKYIDSINYGTGENSLSADWFKLVEYVKMVAPDILQGVTTNGYLSAAMARNCEHEKIVDNCISDIDVSLDYFDSKKHNAFRGQVKAYQWVMDTLERFYGSDKLLTIVMLGTNDTLHINNVEGIMKIADKYNAKLRINLYRPTGGVNPFSQAFIPDYATILNAIRYMNENHKILSICDPLFNSILNGDMTQKEVDSSGSKSLRILHNGDITPSTYLISDNFRTRNIIEKDVLATLEFSEQMVWDKLVTPVTCQACKYVEFCKGGALDRRYLWYDNINVQDPYCPYRKGNGEPDFKIALDKEPFESIHYGYLPTMFFKP